MLCTLSGRGHPVGQGHEVAVGGPGGAEVVGSLFEFLAQVEHLLFQLADAGPEGLGFVGASDAAGLEDLFAEYFGQPGGEVDVLPPEPLVLFAEVGQVCEQRLLAGGGGCGAVLGDGGACVDLGAQIVVTVEERPVDAGGPGDGRDTDLLPAAASWSRALSTRCRRRVLSRRRAAMRDSVVWPVMRGLPAAGRARVGGCSACPGELCDGSCGPPRRPG